MFKKRIKGGAKYNNKQTDCLSKHSHRSKKEARYCDTLASRLENGEILDYQVEVSFTLQDKDKVNEECLRAITYKADFVIIHLDNSIEIVDVKGWRTEVFRMKWKMLKHKYKNHNYQFTLA